MRFTFHVFIATLAAAGLSSCSSQTPRAEVSAKVPAQKEVLDSTSEQSRCGPKQTDMPNDLKMIGATGTTYVQFSVNEKGTVEKKSILASSGFPRLDEIALAKFSECKFSAVKKDGVPIFMNFRFQFSWKPN